MKREETYERAAWLVTAVACFAVGVFVGGRACSSKPEIVEKTIVEEEIVEVCRENCEPRDVGVAVDPVPAARREPPSDHAKKLPQASTTVIPATRRKLLAWVKERSAEDLAACRRNLTEVARVTVTVRFREGRARSARINATEGGIPNSTRSCVERRIEAWEFPAELVEGQSEVLFGLRL